MTEYSMFDKILMISVAVIIYRLLRWRMLVTTHEYRVSVGEEAVRLSFDLRVTEETRKSLLLMAKAMYQPAVPWFIAIAMIIAAIPFRSFQRVVVSEDADVADRTQRVRFQLVLALISASPVAYGIGMLALGVGILLRSSLSVAKEAMAAAGDMSFQKIQTLKRVNAYH